MLNKVLLIPMFNLTGIFIGIARWLNMLTLFTAWIIGERSHPRTVETGRAPGSTPSWCASGFAHLSSWLWIGLTNPLRSSCNAQHATPTAYRVSSKLVEDSNHGPYVSPRHPRKKEDRTIWFNVHRFYSGSFYIQITLSYIRKYTCKQSVDELVHVYLQWQ
jgi:hypothetical protein